jgi:hypothetical protein
MNEAHDLGDSGRFDRFALYERVKTYAAAPPDVLPCVDKYIRRHYVPNVLGLVVTTNRKTDGIYLPSDDRRHFVCWSERAKENFAEKYWTEKWNWLLHEGGATHVAAYLARRDLKNFDPCAVPRATAAFEEIVNANLSPEDADLADALDELGEPKIVTLALILEKSTVAAALEWLLAPKSRRSIPHRLERCGYVAVRNPEAASNGLWRINGRRQTLYGKSSLTPEQRQAAATKYATEANTKAKTASNNGS